MKILGHALLCAKDNTLLDTRMRVLTKAGIVSTGVRSVEEINGLETETDFDLVVLDQLLTADECRRAHSIIKGRWPRAGILIFHMAGGRYEELQGCESIATLSSPDVFVSQSLALIEASRRSESG
jgi:hypothetical protein